MSQGEKEAIYRGDIIKFGSEVVRGSGTCLDEDEEAALDCFPRPIRWLPLSSAAPFSSSSDNFPESFPPLQVHVSFDWAGDGPLRLPDAPKMTHVQPAGNTFTVPDDDDIDDDSDLEIIRESVCAPRLEVLIPSRIYAVPESDISCAGSVSSDDDVSAPQSPDTSAVQLEPVSPSPIKIARSRDFSDESKHVTVFSPQPVAPCIDFVEEEPAMHVSAPVPLPTSVQSRSDERERDDVYDYAAIDMDDDITESEIELADEFSDDLFDGDELELEAIQSDPPQDEDQDTEEPVGIENQQKWAAPSCRVQTPPTAEPGRFQQSQDEVQLHAATARTPSPSDAAMPKMLAPSCTSATAHCQTGPLYDSVPFSVPTASGSHLPYSTSTLWPYPRRPEWPAYCLPCQPSPAYNEGPFQRNAEARSLDGASATQCLYPGQPDLSSFVSCDRQPDAAHVYSYNTPTPANPSAPMSQTAKKLSINDILDNEAQNHASKPKTTSVKRKADEISGDDENDGPQEIDETSIEILSKNTNTTTTGLECGTLGISPISPTMPNIVGSSNANVCFADAGPEPVCKRARTGTTITAGTLAGVVVGGVIGSVATVAALVALPAGFFA